LGKGSVECNGSSLGCCIDGSPLQHRRRKDTQGKERFFVNIRDTLDFLVVKEKVPVKCLPFS
jgi:hypothetical protein